MKEGKSCYDQESKSCSGDDRHISTGVVRLTTSGQTLITNAGNICFLYSLSSSVQTTNETNSLESDEQNSYFLFLDMFNRKHVD